MKDIIFDSFQNDVSESLLRHKSILDIITKYAESSCRINRAVAKSVTNCGCIEINAKKQCLPNDDNSLEDLSTCLQTHLDGCLCDNWMSLLAPPSLCSMTRSRRLPALTRRWNTVAARFWPSDTLCSMRTFVPSCRQTAPSAAIAHCAPL